MNSDKTKHRPFALVLSGGGGRGLAHVGVLKALEHYGFRPGAIVGVSMGAVVAATYALNPDWYAALVNMDTRSFPAPARATRDDLRARIRAVLGSERALLEMFLGWGVGERSLEAGKELLRSLTLGGRLEDGRIPVAIIAADLRSGQRAVLKRGIAADAAYASSALPGVLPPLERGKQLLVDGSYVDNAPVDVARGFGAEVVVAVDASQYRDPPEIRNGFQAMIRAMEVCHYQHAQLRFDEADLVIKPKYPFPIETLDFAHKRLCVAVGVRAVRRCKAKLERLLRAKPDANRN